MDRTEYLYTLLSQEGFEPPTTWFVAMCSSPLSYKLSNKFSFKYILLYIYFFEITIK